MDYGNESKSSANHLSIWRRFLRWLDVRTNLHSLLHHALDEPIPGGARFAYVFGSLLLFLFVSQTITGIFLALYYVPSADHAHTTISYIVKEVTGGSFLRGLHAYGSSAIIIVLALHIAQTFIFGSYKGRRELLWVSGCVLALLMLGMAFTGYLLPWDQKAYFATAVGTNLSNEVPGIGGWLKRLMRGGDDMGTLTLSRFFVAHVFLIPALIMAFVAGHIYFFRKAGAAGPPEAHPIRPQLPAERFYPRQVVMDLTVTCLLIVALGALAHFFPTPLDPKADPADTQYLPRPEWYYRPFFQWLKYWSGRLTIVGILIIPLSLLFIFVGIPFLDRRLERRPSRRPLAIAFFSAGVLGIVILGMLSYLDDARDPSVASQLRKQRWQTERFMQSAFEPEFASASLISSNVALTNPALTAGKQVYEAEACDACHGSAGEGTPDGVSLIGISRKHPPEKLEEILRDPTPQMIKGGMIPLEISAEEMRALVNYLNSFR